MSRHPEVEPRARGPRMHAQVLILLAMTLFAGPGSSRTDLAGLCRDTIDDERRADAAARVAAEIDDELAATRADVLEFRRFLLGVLAPHESDLGPLDHAGEEFETRMWKHQERMLALRDRLRGLTTPAEWAEIFAALREAREEALEEALER